MLIRSTKMLNPFHVIIVTLALYSASCRDKPQPHLSNYSDESTARFDDPMDRVSALKHIDLPLPPSTHTVYFFEHVEGMQGLNRFIRFDVSPKELDSAVQAMIDANEKAMKRTLLYPTLAITASTLYPPRKDFQPLKWWNPSSVKNGYYRGHINAYALQILVDKDHSRIYIYMSD